MQIQIAELTSRVFAISKLSSLESYFFGGGSWGGAGITAFIYISMYIFLTVGLQLCVMSILSAVPGGLCTDQKEPNNSGRVGTAFFLSFHLLECLCAALAFVQRKTQGELSISVQGCRER